MRPVSASLLATCLLVNLAAPPARALVARPAGASEHGSLPDMDVRLDRRAQVLASLVLVRGGDPTALVAGPTAEPGAARLAAVSALERSAGSTVSVRWDSVTGSPRILHARSGFLTPPDARPTDVVAREFLRTNRDLFLLSDAQVNGLAARDPVPLGGGGGVVWLDQLVDGLPVLEGRVGVAVAADGRVVSVLGGAVTGSGRLPSVAPSSAPGQAAAALARAAGVELTALPAALPGSPRRFALAAVDNGPIDVRLLVAPTAWGPRLAWAAGLKPRGVSAWYEVVVDDATLQPLRRVNRTWTADTRGRAFANNPDTGPHEIFRFFDAEDYRSDLSPKGWADADTSSGNNAIVRDDRAGDDDQTLGREAQAAAGAPVLFDFPFTDDPSADLDAVLVNLFRGVNLAHDHFLERGFDSASGNFEADASGRGGLGGDPVLAEAQDPTAANNANFTTQPDGSPSVMQMGIWDGSGRPRDSALDLGVIVHEYGHGVTTRLVGGPGDATCLFGLQGASMGEGWSDFFAASLLEDPIIGAYPSGNPAGIRPFRLDQNPPAGKDYRDFCGYANDFSPVFCEPHDNGNMWSGFLWLVREALIARYGAPAGVVLAENLVVEALKLTPCGPSMVEGRDALVLADRSRTGGENECLILEAARNRWMGFSAASAGGSDAVPIAANDAWPQCQGSGLVRFGREGLEAAALAPRYSCADLVDIQVVDGNATGPVRVNVSTSGGDNEQLDLNAAADPAVFTGSITSSSGTPVPSNGLLEVTDGDVITARYFDGGFAVVAQAEVDCDARLEILRPRFSRSTCDLDEVPGFPELPGFLDAGESADLTFVLRNGMPVDVVGGVTVTTDRPDFVTVLPSSRIPISLKRTLGTGQSEQEVTVRIVWHDPSVAPIPADIGLEVRLDAPGFTPGPHVLRLPIHLDYVLATGLTSSHDVETELVAPVGPDWSTGSLVAGGNEWRTVTCSPPPTGTRAYRNGPALSCTANYTDAQGDPWLASPPVVQLGPTTQAARLTGATWQHDIDLGSAGVPAFGIPPAFDADAVLVLATNDPASLDSSEPLALALAAITFYAHVEVPGVIDINSNTTGWTPESVAIQPTHAAKVDLLQPTYLTWLFLPDVTPSTFQGFPFDAQADGYFLDDLVVTYDRVDGVPQAAPACAPGVTPFAYPVVLDPPSGAACAGNRVRVDGSLSEAALCPLGILEYRFLVGGSPLACFAVDGVTPRAQDVDGWGTDATCVDYPAADTTYDLEVRCQAAPTPTDVRSVSVRVADGLLLAAAQPAASCAASTQRTTLTVTDASLVPCAGVPELEFRDGAGNPLDCDGDTVADGFSTRATCDVGSSGSDRTFVVAMRCSSGSGCEVLHQVVVPAIQLMPALALVNPPEPCPGQPFLLSAAGTVATGCSGGTVEYRFFDDFSNVVACTGRLQDGGGWGADPTCTTSTAGTGAYLAEARCTLDPSCPSPLALRLVQVGDGVPTGVPPGLLRVTKTATCPDTTGDAVLDWAMSLTPPATAIVRTSDPTAMLTPPIHAASLATTTHADVDVTCDDAGGARWRGAAIYFYAVFARDTCTDAPIADGDVLP